MFEDVLEEIDQMAAFKYGALAHWGKSRKVAFARVIKKYENYTEFLKVNDEYDPSGRFSKEWMNKNFKIDQEKVMIEKDGCALEGLCVLDRLALRSG
ncbi:hypothetical protein MLD38_018861 [Melastoma candidum]|uniref:Uncharacterized protein n=1 Tax=Melastoma candidum TaxID=119954 RepID=A0ACB9QX16_9MYRT|nr:hypothetical protein MLD38_018861 [Melastoma candidum]